MSPTYTTSTAHQVMDENQMANAILRSASDEISEGTALYLDGELTAVCADGTSLQSYINGLLLPYEDEENANVTVGFNRAVDLEQGIYFNESFQDLTDIENTLSGVQQAEKIYKVQAGDTLVGHCPEKRPDLQGALRPEHELQGSTPHRDLQHPGRGRADRHQRGSHAGGADHQDRGEAGGNPLHH